MAGYIYGYLCQMDGSTDERISQRDIERSLQKSLSICPRVGEVYLDDPKRGRVGERGPIYLPSALLEVYLDDPKKASLVGG